MSNRYFYLENNEWKSSTKSVAGSIPLYTGSPCQTGDVALFLLRLDKRCHVNSNIKYIDYDEFIQSHKKELESHNVDYSFLESLMFGEDDVPYVPVALPEYSLEKEYKKKTSKKTKSAPEKVQAKPEEVHTNTERIYLTATYQTKDIVKKMGAKFDGDKKKWYCTPQQQEQFKEWIKAS